jgi:hypothetical protein
MTGHTDYTIRQTAYDLRKLRGEDLVVKPGRSHRYHLTAQPARIITALLLRHGLPDLAHRSDISAAKVSATGRRGS